jgi:putative transposase
MISRRVTQRLLLMRPDSATNNAFLYCLIEAALRFQIDIVVSCAMSNHHHTVIFDRWGRYPQFIERFHKLMARSQNALRGRWENFWSAGQTSVVRLVDREDVLRKAVYAATNPVKDLLVERVQQWPGVNTLSALVRGTTLKASLPRHFFRRGKAMPESVELKMALPPELGPSETFIAELSSRVGDVERAVLAERLSSGRSILGRRQVLRQKWNARPATSEPRRALSPRVAAHDKWRRIETLLEDRMWRRAYADARASWLEGRPALFPTGTYWLRRFANVPVTAS